MNERNPESDQPTDRTVPPFPGRWSRARARLAAFHWRDYWWHLLDRWETQRSFRLAAFGLVLVLAVLAGLVFWAYPTWTRRNSIKMARQWLDSGHYKNAVEAVQQAMILNPASPEPWMLAAELARRGGQKDKALEYSRHAGELAPEDPVVMTGWAADALRADQPDEADRVMDRMPVVEQAASAYVQRLRGELARRQSRLTAAKGYFEAAIRLEGPLAINEVPLGLILLDASDPGVRQHGIDLLSKWASDREWGATALRNLLTDAVARGDSPAMRKWAEALRLHPGCLVADMPNCLLALSKADEAHFAEVLAQLEKDHAVTPQAAVQLLSWLNQIGHGVEAVRWMKTLPTPAMRRPPLVVAGAEALRLAGDWPGLEEWTRKGNWGPDVDFLRWAYGLQAAHMLGDKPQEEELWRTLYSHAQLNSVHALFAASTIYGWGRVTEAEALWWRAAEQEGKIAIDALGSLARHYQVRRDADGQYRVFRQLHLLQPQSAAVGNNFAFFAALTGHEQRLAEEVARANLASDPRNPIYLATCAFTLVMQNRAESALTMLKPMAADAARSPALALVYGLALAGTNRKTEAHALLDRLPPDTLTLRELAVVKNALAD